MDEELDPREAARTRRRDRDADGEERDLMRPGMGKVFKQIQDSWAKHASTTQGQPGKRDLKGRNRPGRGG